VLSAESGKRRAGSVVDLAKHPCGLDVAALHELVDEAVLCHVAEVGKERLGRVVHVLVDSCGPVLGQEPVVDKCSGVFLTDQRLN